MCHLDNWVIFVLLKIEMEHIDSFSFPHSPQPEIGADPDGERLLWLNFKH